MEFNNSNQERTSNSSEALTPKGVLSTNDYGSNNQLLSYHRRSPDGEYVPVMLSPGYYFCPKDDELVVDFLNKEINKDRPEYIRILNVNVYNHSPEELARTYQSLGNGEWYFFSPREKKYANGTRPNRAAGNGYWKATGADKEIHRDGKPVGSKKCLVFYIGKPPKGDKTDWIMHEYVSKDSKKPPKQPPRQQRTSADMRLDDCVLCRIYKKSEHSPRTEEGNPDSEPGETLKSEAGQSSEGSNLQAARKRVKTKHRGTNQQQQLKNFQVPQITTQINFNPSQQNISLSRQNQQQLLSFQVPQNINASPQNLSLSRQNQQQAIHHSLQGWSTYNPDIQAAAGGYNLGGQLDHRLETNPDDAQPIMDVTHSSFAPPPQNLQGMQYSDYIQAVGGYINIPGGEVHYPGETQQFMDMAQASFASPPPQNQLSMQYRSNPAGDYNLGQQFDHRREINPVEAQPITVWPPNLPNTCSSLQEGSSSHINLDGEFDFGQGSIQEDANMFRYDDNVGISHETDFGDLIRNNTVGNLSSYSQTFQNGFGFNEFYQFSSTDSITPIPPPLDANHDHPQNGEAIQRDQKLVDRNPARSTTDNIYDHPGEQS